MDWLAAADPREDYLLVFDADMIMRRPILPQARPAVFALLGLARVGAGAIVRRPFLRLR